MSETPKKPRASTTPGEGRDLLTRLDAGPGLSSHDHGNCELCDWIEARLNEARAELGRLYGKR